ncbi:MAG: peptidylprolyl isomerase [Clostridiales bacterium]|nr:peptidylprolyl isomerase [Clostridiales bacterium]
MKWFRHSVSIFFIIAFMLAFFAGCAAKTSPVVMVIGGTNVDARDYAYFLRVNSSNVDPAEGDDGEKTAKEAAANQIIQMQTIFKKASELGVELTKEDREQLKTSKKENIDAVGGTAAYEKALKQSGMTDTLYDKISEYSFLYDKLSKVLYSSGGTEEPTDKEITDFFNKNYVTVTHILKKTTDAEGNPLNETAVEKKNKDIEKILEKIRAGADFLTLVKSENEDSGLTEANGYQYTFTRAALNPQGAMEPEFEDAAFSLSVGGISSIVETEYGYHIIKRLKNNESYLEKNRNDVISVMADGLYAKLVQSWMDEIQVTYTDEYKKKLSIIWTVT